MKIFINELEQTYRFHLYRLHPNSDPMSKEDIAYHKGSANAVKHALYLLGYSTDDIVALHKAVDKTAEKVSKVKKAKKEATI